MRYLVLGSFKGLDLYEITEEPRLTKVRELSKHSCLFSQYLTGEELNYAYYEEDLRVVVVKRDAAGNETSACVELAESPYSFYISPGGNHLVVMYREFYNVISVATGNSVLSGVKTTGGKFYGAFDDTGRRLVYQDQLYVKILDFETGEIVVAHYLKNYRYTTLAFAGRYVIIAAPYHSGGDVGFIKIFDGETLVLNQNYQKVDSFDLRMSNFGCWFVAVAKCEVNDTEQNYYYYGTRQIHFFDIKGRKVLNFSTAGQQVHAVGIQILDLAIKQELLTYIVEKVPTVVKLAIVQTQTNVCTLKQFSLGNKTTINSISAGTECLILRGEGNMDGVCYSCKVNPQGQAFTSVVKIQSKKRILYKTHVQFASGLIIMGTLAPRLNVDNGVWVYDEKLNELLSFPYEKLMKMEVLLAPNTSYKSKLTETVESNDLTFDSPDGGSYANAYVPPGLRAKKQAAAAPSGQSQSFSLFQ